MGAEQSNRQRTEIRRRKDTVEPRDGGAYLSVAEQGVGVSLDDAERIFDRFARIRSDDNISGLGLGLYIARRIIQEHGGTICVESEAGRGAGFIVEV
ncbi:MAG: sensor histidine kinase [Chloroflexota bacterium]